MQCPRCQNMEDRVVESRTLADGASIRRRRECISCGYRYTSYERIEERPLVVVKTRGGREPFDRAKLERGIVQAIRKRPVSRLQVEEILNGIEEDALTNNKTAREVTSRELGEAVLSRLYSLDRVAYVRFASVYRNYEDVKEFIQEIERLPEDQKPLT